MGTVNSSLVRTEGSFDRSVFFFGGGGWRGGSLLKIHRTFLFTLNIGLSHRQGSELFFVFFVVVFFFFFFFLFGLGRWGGGGCN